MMMTRFLFTFSLSVFLFALAGCSRGGENDSCFIDENCRGSLICCGATGTSRGICEYECSTDPSRPGSDASIPPEEEEEECDPTVEECEEECDPTVDEYEEECDLNVEECEER